MVKFDLGYNLPVIMRVMALFSSPEHEVLMVSYCGQSMSVMPRVASTIALKAYSSYLVGGIGVTYRSKIAKIMPIVKRAPVA